MSHIFGGLGLYSFFRFHCILGSFAYSMTNEELISISLFIFVFVEGEFATLVVCCVVLTPVVDLLDENDLMLSTGKPKKEKKLWP